MSTREAVFFYIVEYKRQHDGNSPSHREIVRGCKLSRHALAQYHLRQLEKDGRIVLNGDHSSRGIQVIGGHWAFEEPNGH